MSAQAQNRQPAGVPVGGQFATQARIEPDMHLDAPELETDEGRRSPVHDMPSSLVPSAIARIDAANRRLERAGVEGRFTYTAEEYVRTRSVDDHGFSSAIHEQRTKLTLNEPTMAYGGWTFIAALDSAEAGFIARTVPGLSLDGWRPEEQVCDHCGKERRRNHTYIVQNEDGQRMQVGATCLELFLGVKPQGLWALGYDLELDGDDSESSGGAGGSDIMPVRELIATALAVSDGGKDFVSRALASESRLATATLVEEQLFGRSHNRQEAEERAAVQDRANAYLVDGTVDATIKAAQEMTGDGDYATNMRTVTAGEWVSPRHIGLVASSVMAWRREQERAATKAAITPGFIGAEGAKIAGVKATVTKVTYIDDPYSYYGGVNTLVIFQADDGHQVKWFASGRKDFEVGAAGQFTGGSVKKHDTYQGVDQTVVTRAKFEATDPAHP